MKLKLPHIFYSLCFLGILVYSCSSTKYVPENQYLLGNTSVKVDAKDISYFDLEPYVKQKSNYKTFELFKFPLFVYNLSGKDSTKWYNKALKNGGEPPVIFDSTQVSRTISQLNRVMYNKGYFDAETKPEIKTLPKKIDVLYNIKSGSPTIINNYIVNINDSIFEQEMVDKGLRVPRRLRNRPDSSSMNIERYLSLASLIKKGDQFDFNLLDNERDRITSIFRRNGYMRFGKEFIGFIADTTTSKTNIDLELVIYPYSQNIGNNQIIESMHRQYHVDNVDIYIDYNPITDGELSRFEASSTVVRDKYKIFYGKKGRYIKPHIILEGCYIQPGELFNDLRTSSTYTALAQLQILKNINIRYEEYLENDSTKLRCVITAIPDKRQGTSAEIEGTNSAGYFGIGAGLGYSHRNVFKGSELFNAKVRGSYEAVTPNFSKFGDNYFEVGGEVSLTFPRFMFPFISYDLRRRLRSSTQFFSTYTYQRRPEYFTRTVFSTGIKYIWENRRNSTVRHTLDLIDISYAHLPTLNAEFESTLSDNAKIYSFTDQFIVSIGYSYNKTNNVLSTLPSQRRNRSTYSLRTSFETAGNTLSLLGALTNVPKDENGSRKIFNTYYAQYAKGNIDYSKTIRIDDRNAFAWRLGGGIAFPYGNNKLVPFQKRFYSGGANNVRGWAARELGPGSFYREDANFNDQSGDIRFDANIELRSKAFWKLELATFLDAGNIWTIKGTDRQYKGQFEFQKFYKQIASSWGLGFRLDLDFLLIRLDCGWKLYNPADTPHYKQDASGYLVPDGYKSKWAILKPLRLRENTAWHIAVGYPF